MYTVIGGTKTRAFRVMWMLEELGQPYDLTPRHPARTRRANTTLQARSPRLWTAMRC